jgi:DNA repair exonuclease SbcCD ATPase subunit
MKIKIKSMTLENFKGAKKLAIDLSDVTTIEGDNGTGKTTIFDAFLWLAWGRNSENETNFGVKTWDENNEPIHRLTHSATAYIEMEDNGIVSDWVIQREMREKWQKKRGSEQEYFTGHETTFSINGVAKSQSEFKSFINSIIPERISRMITDPYFFNKHMKWEERRMMLTEIAGEVSDHEILLLNPELDLIFDILNSDTPGDKFQNEKSKIASKIKLLKTDLIDIPSRIDEVHKSMPEVFAWEDLENDKSELLTQKSLIEKKISDEQARMNNEFEKVRTLAQEKNELTLKVDELRSELKQSANSKRNELTLKKSQIENELSKLESDLKLSDSTIAGNKVQIEKLQKEKDDLKKQYEELRELPVLTQYNDTCPLCKRSLPEDDLQIKKEKAIEESNAQRVDQLNALAEKAKEKNKEIQALQSSISNIEQAQLKTFSDIKEKREELSLIGEIPEVRSVVDSNEICEILNRIEIIRELISQPSNSDKSDLEQSKKEIDDRLKDLDRKLSNKELIDQFNNRISELLEKQKSTGIEIAKLERIENQIATFQKIKIQAVEDRVNSLFENVQFKMFEPLVNGGEQPTCICTLSGVNFQDLNTASKINAGLDVIRTLQNHFDIFAPVFIDNRESVSEIIDMKCQIINLVKVKGVKQIKVN